MIDRSQVGTPTTTRGITVTRIKKLTVEKIRQIYKEKEEALRSKFGEFGQAYNEGDDRIFEELVFCILTAAASARMGIKCVESLRPALKSGTKEDFVKAIAGLHIYPESRADYIAHTRDYLKSELDFKLKEKIQSLVDPDVRRDFFANNEGIKGIGYKEASHFLRNIGFKGYAILDKHVLTCLTELGVIDNPKPPPNKKKYLEIETKMRQFTAKIGVNFDDLDLIFWSSKTGVILK